MSRSAGLVGSGVSVQCIEASDQTISKNVEIQKLRKKYNLYTIREKKKNKNKLRNNKKEKQWQ